MYAVDDMYDCFGGNSACFNHVSFMWHVQIAIGQQQDDPQGKRATGQYKVAVGIGVDRSTCPPHPGKAPGTFGYYGRSGEPYMYGASLTCQKTCLP
jgi:hypothetical protein